MNQTNVIIVSAPSGSGKSTLVRLLLEKVGGLVFSISYTTREPRAGEKDGQDYCFISPDEFRRRLEQNEFLEHAVLFGTHYYGTSRRFLDEARTAGKDLLLDIDVQGAAQVKQRVPDALSVFILPPSRDELEHRLRYRRLDQEHVIERRLRQAAIEISGCAAYDYVLVNDKVEPASECLNSIVLAARWQRRQGANGAQPDAEVKRWMELAESRRTERVRSEIEPILKTFDVSKKEP
jgi:guanylate kinase